ncbi:MAG: SDR family NAD(P)-dependent oxidoreductase [Enterobacterales bacterium]|nr:SDR family NAD(P)-dependent oxidoreductase [Enterobacterales bacterium]
MAKIALITGASSGFGRASARLLAASGWQLVLVARRLERLQSLQAELGESVLEIIELDVRHADAVAAALAPWNGKINLLLNNAGLAAGLDPAWTADLTDWEMMVDTNIKGLNYVTRALLDGMVNNRSGHVINIGSIAGSYPYPGGNAYGATKAYVAQFSLNLRADLHGTGVRVTNIEPGLAETEFSNVRFKGDAVKADAIYENLQPLSPEDIAETIRWCAELPEHVNINRLEVMPSCQSFSALAVHRDN